MIRLHRPSEVPAKLRTPGEKQTASDCASFDTCGADYASGRLKFPNRTYYNRSEVKTVLTRMHHSKCCYCEQSLRTRAYLHVEHFRPKSGVRQRLKQPRDEFPGYYWLAYRWDNLLLACHDCNSRFKRTLFPLKNPRSRARSHRDDINKERPSLIDPAGEDPRAHIRYDEDAPKAITARGAITIRALGLRRVNLREQRLTCLAQLEFYFDVLSLAAEHPRSRKHQALSRRARRYIESATTPSAEFSSMAIDYVAFRQA
jgi:uncharacterized protein (TIGR02646 family)